MAKTPTRPRKPGRPGRLLLVAATLTGLAAVPAAAAVTAPETTGTQTKPQAQAAPEAPEAPEERTAAERQAATEYRSTPRERTAPEGGTEQQEKQRQPLEPRPEVRKQQPTSPPRDGSPGPVYERVAHFYAAYIDIANDPGDNTAAGELRKFYLTSDLRTRLLKWEQQHEADGVLMAQNVPSAWKVTPGDSGMGHTWSTVRLTWGTGQDRTYTYLAVQSDLATRKISDIKSKY